MEKRRLKNVLDEADTKKLARFYAKQRIGVLRNVGRVGKSRL